MIFTTRTGHGEQTRLTTQHLAVRGDRLTPVVRDLLRDNTVRHIVVRSGSEQSLLEVPVRSAATESAANVLLAALSTISGLIDVWRVDVGRVPAPAPA